MCGIVGYVGKQEILGVLIDGLKALEYRGYDSAGVGLVINGGLSVYKKAGRVADLEEFLAGKKINNQTNTGIAHTRWATHGEPNDINAHPHLDCKGNIAVVHNGIIENYKELKDQLIKKGHKFISETDTEVLAHLIEEKQKENKNLSLEESVRQSLLKVRGTYGLAVIDAKEPLKIVAVRNFSPLLLGIGNGEYIIASDASAVLRYTRQIIYLNNNEMAVIEPDRYRIYNFQNQIIDRKPQEIEWSLESIKKGGYPHFMLKEIFEQPEAIKNSLRGRLIIEEGLTKLGGLESVEIELRETRRILIAACGTAYLAGKVGEYMIEEYANIPVEVDFASEFRYRKPVFERGDLLLAISQSGETADTLAALKEAKQKNVLTLGIINAIGSSIARETDAGIYQHIGPEIGVASTKAFTSQLAILALITIFLGRQRQMSLIMGKRIAQELVRIPDLLKKILRAAEKIKKIAKKYKKYKNFLFLGRKYNMPIALEGALKLKEISYIHAEGCGAGEMKHGSLALIDKNFPSFVIAPHDSVYEKNLSNIEEIKTRKGPVIAIATEDDIKIKKIVDDVIYIPKTLEMLTPILSVVPLQLFAYYFAVEKGCDVDKPRNLAKSVTVE